MSAYVQAGFGSKRSFGLSCLEETANIGDTKELTLGDLVRICVLPQMGRVQSGDALSLSCAGEG